MNVDGKSEVFDPPRDVSVAKPPILRAWIGVFKQAKEVKYWKLYIIETSASISTKFCRTTETTKLVVIIGGHSTRPANPRWRTASILKKKPLNATSLQLFDRFWRNLATWQISACYSKPTVKISNFWKFKMAAPVVLKVTKIAISMQRFYRSLRNLVRLCKMGFFSPHWSLKMNFEKVQYGAYGRLCENC